MLKLNYRALLSVVYCVLSLVFLICGYFTAGLLFSILGYLVFMRFIKKQVGWNSIYFFFLLLFGLYGYSVPLSVFFNLDIGWHRVEKLSTWEQVDFTLISFLISNQLAFLAITIVSAIFINKRSMRQKSHEPQKLKLIYFELSLLAGAIASVSEAINFIRVGGLSAIVQGKAFYQGAVNDLVLNIPYEGFLFMSAALFSIFFSYTNGKDRWLRYFLPYVLSVIFVLGINLLIGERGTLVVFGATFILGYYLRIRLKIIRAKVIVLFLIIYAGINVLTLLREPTVKFNGIWEFWGKYNQKIFWLMNPANTEFAASALNYRIFIDRKEEPYKYKWGNTYSEFIWAFVPTYIYPDKPQSIIYEYRDKYFPERRSMGSTAGTGFSSYIEAYMNYWFFGPFLVYFILAAVLIYLESNRHRSSLLMCLIYLLSFNIVLIFSRSASQYVLSTAISYTLQILVLVMVYQLIPKKFLKLLSSTNENT